MSPMMQQEHGSLEAKPEMPKSEVLKLDVLEPDELELKDLKLEILTASQANPPEEPPLMHHPENIPDFSSQVLLSFQMLGLPSGLNALNGSQQQLLVSVLYHAMQLVLADTTQVESNATNARNIDSQGAFLNEALQHAAVTM